MNIYSFATPAPEYAAPIHSSMSSAPSTRKARSHCLQLAHVLNAMKLSSTSSSPARSSAACRPPARRHRDRLRGQDPHLQRPRPRRHLRPVPEPAAASAPPTRTSSSSATTPTSPASSDRCSVPASDDATAAASVRLRKGSLARLNLQRGPATLQWLLDPRIVRALYATSTKSSRRKTSRK